MQAPSGRPFAEHLQNLNELGANPVLEKAPLPVQHHFGIQPFPSESCKIFHLPLRQSHILAMEGPALNLQLDSSPWDSLIYILTGNLCITQKHEQLECTGGGLALIPRQSYNWNSNAFSIICMMTAPEAMTEIIRSVAEYRGLDKPTQQSPLQKLLWIENSGDPINSDLFSALDKHLSIASDLAPHPALIHQLQIDLQIQRLAIALAFPEYRCSGPLKQPSTEVAPENDPLEAVLHYIDQHLAEPLTLSDLEAASNYSRRALQYAFRQRLGCTATQWIRAQRLDRARTLLLNANDGDTVTGIAQACGYRSMGLFSVEFQQRFHIKPSAILRQLSRDNYTIGRPDAIQN